MSEKGGVPIMDDNNTWSTTVMFCIASILCLIYFTSTVIEKQNPIIYNETYISTHSTDTWEDRESECRESEIYYKCNGIVHELGKGFFGGFFGGTYKEKDLVIKHIVDLEQVVTKVTYRGTIVLSIEDDCMGYVVINTYRPDIASWVNQINQIYEDQIKPLRAKQLQEKMWGIIG